MNAVSRDSQAEGLARYLLWVIAGFADADGVSFPGLALLHEETKMGERTILRHLAALVEAGELQELPKVGSTGVRRYFVAACGPANLAGREPAGPAKSGSSTCQKRSVDLPRVVSTTVLEQSVTKRTRESTRRAVALSAVCQVYREICGKIPNDVQREMIDSHVHGRDLVAWRGVCTWWMGKGYNPRNVSGLVDKLGGELQGKASSPAAVAEVPRRDDLAALFPEAEFQTNGAHT